MEKSSLTKRVERWFIFISPIVSLILIIFLYNMLSEKTTTRVITSTLTPFIFSFLIAWILNPVVVKLCDKFKIQRWLSTLIVVTAIIGAIVLLVMWFIPQLTKQFAFLSTYFPSVAPEITKTIEEITTKLNFELDKDFFKLIDEELTGMLKSVFSNGVKVISSSFSILGNVVSSLFVALMVLMAGIYILIDFDKFNKAVYRVVPARMKDDFDFLQKETNRVVVGYLRGLIVETIIVGILAYIALSILKIEGALVFAVIIGITNILPYFGPYIGAIPVSLFALTDSVQLFIMVGIAVIIVQQIDGIIIKPKVFGKTTDVHPAISIIAIILFGKIFGFIGVVFAIPIAGFTIIIIKFVYNKMLIKYPEKLR